MSTKADIPLNGLIGVMEAVLETAKRFQVYDQTYQANQAAFDRIQEQFRQMQDGATHLQSLAEERLASLSALNVELKARHAQGEQVMAEVRRMLDEVKAHQARTQADGDRAAQLAQTLGVVETLVARLQEKQAPLEQSLLALETLLQDLGRRHAGQEGALAEVRTVAGEFSERLAHVEKTLTTVKAAQEAEKGLISHFEKTLNGVRSLAADLEKRQGQLELALAAAKTTGAGGENAGQQSSSAVIELIQQANERQAALAARVEEIAVQTAQALEKVSAAPPAAGTADPATSQDFQKFLQKCQEEYKAALERENKLQAQWRRTLDTLPQRTEAYVQKFLENSQVRMDQTLNSWLQKREQRAAEAEKQYAEAANVVMERQKNLEQQLAKLSSQAQPQPVSSEWMHAVEAATTAQSNDIRFVKMLLYITLAAVGLCYGLVMYAVMLRGGS